MSKFSKKKSYTEDVVLNKILKEISEESVDTLHLSDENHTAPNSYEDDLIKHYRRKDIQETRYKYLRIAKVLAILSILIVLLVMFTNYINSITHKETPKKETPVKEIVTPAPVPKANIEKIEPKEIITVKTEPKKVILPQKEEPIKKVKTEREIAKEILRQQMNN